MRRLRAIVFNTLFYAVPIGYMLVSLPLFFAPRRVVQGVLKNQMRTEALLQRLFGIKIEVRGRENIPSGGCLIAAKHQSIWETFMLLPLFEDAGYVYKRELGKIPVFGPYLRKVGMIKIDRGKGASTLREMA